MSQQSPQQTEDQSRPMERGGLWGLLLSGLGLLIPLGIPLSILGIVQGVRARRSARGNETVAPGAITSIVLGVVGVMLWSSVLTAGTWLRAEIGTWMDCVNQANTVTVEQECDAEFRADLEERNVPDPVINLVVDS